jgi:hypothetical protein
MAGRFAKAPAGATLSAVKPRGIPQKKAEGLRPRPVPGKDHRLDFAKRSAVPVPGGDFEALAHLFSFEK